MQEVGPWQSTLRALCAIEAVAESGSSAACGQVAVHFQAHPEAVRRAADSPQASVRQRAQKVLSVLGAWYSSDAGGASQQPPPQLFTGDLLGEVDPAGAAAASLSDLLGESAAQPAPSSASANAAPAASHLLAGLDVSACISTGTASQPAFAAAADPFGGMLLADQQAHAQPPVAGASDLDLLGGLSLESTVLPPAPVRAVTAAAPAQGGGLGDLLGAASLTTDSAATSGAALASLGGLLAGWQAAPSGVQEPGGHQPVPLRSQMSHGPHSGGSTISMQDPQFCKLPRSGAQQHGQQPSLNGGECPASMNDLGAAAGWDISP